MYSQNNEEEVISRHFAGSTGNLLDIGANNGKTLSNSLACIERGWSATLVEPSIKCYKDLMKLHKGNGNVETFNVAISTECGYLNFYESGQHAPQYYGENHGLLSSLIKHETTKWKDEEFTETKVEAYDFKMLVKYSKFKKWDLITIDAEGVDFDILTQIDLNEAGCKMLIVENNGTEEHKYVTYCGIFGMKLHSKTPQNLIFVR